jgi:alpha-L-rhamnosidase
MPHFVDGLDHFEATHEGPHGKITSSWTKKGKKVNYTVIIPANSTATIILPVVAGLKPYLDGKVVEGTEMSTGAGTYEFSWK